VYVIADPERRELDASVRATSPGKFVRLSDGFTHFDEAGPVEGQPVVLVAGMSVPYYIWDPTCASLADAGFRVLRYDYYGRGLSDRPDIAYSQDAYLRQLRELMDAVHLTQPVDLVGLSFGGSVVSSFADRYPDRVRSLVFIDPAFSTTYPMPMLARAPFVWDFLTAVFEERWWPESQLGDFRHPERFPGWPDRYRPQLQYRGFRRAQRSTVVSNTTFDQGPELRRVGRHPRPVLAIWGKDDPNVPFEFSAALLEAMPRARLVAVDDAGHLPQWEQPGIVHPELVRFLRE
jgi:pimeloyl-ACP methyl ester carboxylesterase